MGQHARRTPRRAASPAAAATASTCPRPPRPRGRRSSRAARSGPRRGRAARRQRLPQIAHQRPPFLVVHPTIGKHTDDRHADSGQQDRQRGAAVLEQRLPAGVLRTEAHHPDRPASSGARASTSASTRRTSGPHEREGAAAELVGHLQPQQGHAGDPGRAGEEADPDGERRDDLEVRHQREREQQDAGAGERDAEDPPTAQPGQQPRPPPQTRRPCPRRPRRTARRTRRRPAEVGDVGAGQADHDPTGGEGPGHAEHEGADHGRAHDVGPAVADDAPHAALVGVRRRSRRDAGEARDDDAGDDEGEAVDVERDVDGAAVQPAHDGRERPGRAR